MCTGNVFHNETVSVRGISNRKTLTRSLIQEGEEISNTQSPSYRKLALACSENDN